MAETVYSHACPAQLVQTASKFVRYYFGARKVNQLTLNLSWVRRALVLVKVLTPQSAAEGADADDAIAAISEQWKKKDWHKDMTEMLKGIVASDGVGSC